MTLSRLALLAPVLLASLAAPGRAAQNILLVVIDDVGIDRIGAYAAHPDPGRTPNIDALAAQGLLFRNVWANTTCSPTRATLLTGRYGFRTGVGSNGNEDGSGPALPLSETTLPELLTGYSTAALGKWHLGHDLSHPNDSGFTHFAGLLRNLDRLGPGADYSNWTKLTNGSEVVTTHYATTDTTDDALAQMQSLVEPWFVYCAFQAAHVPTHEPPAALHTYDLSGLAPDDDVPLFTRAMVESLDTEIGRLLAGVPTGTAVILVGDNGTSSFAQDAPTPPGHGKGSFYEGGLRVPLIIHGPGVTPGTCDALVNTTDVFATVAELAGTSSSAEDSISLVPYLSNPTLPSLRAWVYAERFKPGLAQRAIRGPRYKLVQNWTPAYTRQFYDLALDPDELTNLLAAGALAPGEQAAFLELACSLPVELDATNYCTPNPNSTGSPATIAGCGSNSVAANLLELRASGLPPHEPGYFMASLDTGFVPGVAGSAGNLCLGGTIGRFNAQLLSSGGAGSFELWVDLSAIPMSPAAAAAAGETWYFQAWFRDTAVTLTSNMTDGLSVSFQ